MLKLKLQYFGHLMQRADSLEETLMLGKIQSTRRSGQQRMRWFDSITDLMDMNISKLQGFPGGSDGKESACNVGDLGSIPESGRSPGRWYGNPVQYSCLENPHGQRSLTGYSPWGCTESDTTETSKWQEIVDERGELCSTIHGVSKSWTQLGDWTTKYYKLKTT